MSGDRKGWYGLAMAAPLVGAACIVTLIWALNARLDQWDVQGFVLLIYGAAASAVLSSIAGFKRRGAGPLPEAIQVIGQFVWLGVIVTFLWVWFPPMQELVGWVIRQASMFRFS